MTLAQKYLQSSCVMNFLLFFKEILRGLCSNSNVARGGPHLAKVTNNVQKINFLMFKKKKKKNIYPERFFVFACRIFLIFDHRSLLSLQLEFSLTVSKGTAPTKKSTLRNTKIKSCTTLQPLITNDNVVPHWKGLKSFFLELVGQWHGIAIRVCYIL